MTSSGMKRGLAVSAISAMAMTGLPLLAATASADTLESMVASNAVVMYTPEDTGAASFKNDGTDSNIHLLANAGSDVKQVQFEYSTDAGVTFKPIATVSRVNGVFSTYWTPPTAAYNLPTQIRATGLGSVGTPVSGAVDTNTATVTDNANAIDIANAAGSSVGVYQNPDGDEFGAVSGTTSDVAADPTIKLFSPNSTSSNKTDEDIAGKPANGVRTFSGAVDFTGYQWDADATNGTVNEAVVVAEDQSSDAETVSLYKQTIGSVTAVIDPTKVQGDAAGTGIVTVLDKQGMPIVGAHVYLDGTTPTGPVLTNSQGQAEFPGLKDTSANGTGTTYGFFVDEGTGNGTYDSGSEYRREATITRYTPAATSLTGASHDGNAFDVNEYTADLGTGEGDLTVTVNDQNGAPLKGQSVVGKWTGTSFDGSVVKTENATITDTDTDGIYNVALPSSLPDGNWTLDAWIEKDGTPGESAGDLAMPSLSVKAGDSNIEWTDGAVAQRAAGSTGTFEATLALADGTALAGRNVAITWTKTGNAVVAAQSAQPGVTKRTSDSSATSVTGANGTFAVAIADPAASPNVDELGGKLSSNTTDTEGIGNAAETSPDLAVDFLADMAVSKDTSSSAKSNLSADGATPGRPVRVEVTVKNAKGQSLTDLPVKISTDHGFFTTPSATQLSELKADPAAADGANYGEWENLGTTRNTTLDDTGKAHAVVAIERDSGFDDDGLVTANVTFEVGGKSFVQPVVFDSSNPMNPGKVTIDLAAANQQTVTVLPKAPTTENVYFDVHATDQFGNLTDEPIKLSDNSAAAKVFENTPVPAEVANGDVVTSNFTNDGPAIYTTASDATSQVVSGLWTASTIVWKDADTTKAGFQGDTDAADSTDSKTKDLTADSPAIAWYNIDFAKSVYSLDNGAATRNVGDTVHSMFTATDQNGERINGMAVKFFRTGPDQQQDGDGKAPVVTGSAGDGQAAYIWQGTQAGKAVVTTVVSTPQGVLVPSAELSDSVTFVAAPSPRVHINAGLGLSNRRDGADIARVTAPAAAHGAVVKLYKVRANGTRVLVATKTANSAGDARFVVKDRNGRHLTKYIARVGGTARTFADWTPARRIR